MIDRHVRLFDLVAAPYDLFHRSQRIALRRTWREYGSRLGLPPGASILDVGCGTGAFAAVLAARGYRVCAVDPSRQMRRRAARRLRGSGVVVRDGDALRGLPFPDRSFDLVTASFVAHGFPPAARAAFFREVQRVSRGLVLLVDFLPRSIRREAPDVRVLEALEGSDFRRFVRTATAELRAVFAVVEVVPVDTATAWYVCRGRAGARRASLDPAPGRV